VLRELSFNMHFNELGRHTLYVVTRDGEKIGYVHARTEMGEWGLTEYAWALTPQLRIRGVKVQRSRDPELRRTEGPQLGKPLLGKSLTELRLLHADANPRMRSLLQSAMKTIVITKNVWAEESPHLDLLQLARLHLPEAAKLAAIAQLYDTKALVLLKDLELGRSPIFERRSVVGYKIQDEQGRGLALVVETPFEAGDRERVLLWIVSDDGNVREVRDMQAASHDPDFAAVVGFAPADIRDCSTLADIAALEIATLARSHLVD
jgi:hypothetical protein